MIAMNPSGGKRLRETEAMGQVAARRAKAFQDKFRAWTKPMRALRAKVALWLHCG
jgi:hypothetical protein